MAKHRKHLKQWEVCQVQKYFYRSKSNFNTPAVTRSSWNVIKLNSPWLKAMQIFLFHTPINYRSAVSFFVLKRIVTGDTNKQFFFQWLKLTFLKYHITHLADFKHAPIFTCVALVSHTIWINWKWVVQVHVLTRVHRLRMVVELFLLQCWCKYWHLGEQTSWTENNYC